jgi:cytochrome c553
MKFSFLTRRWLTLPAASILLCGLSFAQSHAGQSATLSPPPYWAYCPNPPKDTTDPRAKPVDDTSQHVPNSTASFTLPQIADLFEVPDWHPAGHSAMPAVVAHGRKPDVYACGYCHLPNGLGRPENSSLAGLRVDYITQQMADFKTGRRKSAEPTHLPSAAMVGVATHADDQQVRSAAAYFAELKPKPWIHVVETSTVPKTHVAGWMLVVSEPVVQEPIGRRIIETPENLERTELRDDTSGFIAYVPLGSIKKGKTLVVAGGEGKTMPCATCHGVNLKGSGDVPPLAGRSPSYVVRQLYDIQSGARAGAATQGMMAPVANLTLDDMVAIAAYTSSLQP